MFKTLQNIRLTFKYNNIPVINLCNSQSNKGKITKAKASIFIIYMRKFYLTISINGLKICHKMQEFYFFFLFEVEFFGNSLT